MARRLTLVRRSVHRSARSRRVTKRVVQTRTGIASSYHMAARGQLWSEQLHRGTVISREALFSSAAGSTSFSTMKSQAPVWVSEARHRNPAPSTDRRLSSSLQRQSWHTGGALRHAIFRRLFQVTDPTSAETIQQDPLQQSGGTNRPNFALGTARTI